MKTKRTMTALALLLGITLASCNAIRREPAPVIRTTTFGAGLRGGMVPQTVIETPYESPAYTEAGKRLFARP